MNAMQDSRRAALNVEEAALLPAMPRKHPAGGAALQSALRAAQAIAGKTTGSEVAVDSALPASVPKATSAALPAPSRAALHHALRRREGVKPRPGSGQPGAAPMP